MLFITMLFLGLLAGAIGAGAFPFFFLFFFPILVQKKEGRKVIELTMFKF